ncbi:AAA family ATPase [Halobacillus sp. Marseille-Q1614]|uniref:AAA family ATPase n=1 Tax=Halobacillus sp. Marseille-Q1614 TaxID=2709134 RepID=UPI00156F9F3A|nr:AAA family ATPase [Halobacillus sp. Marseille-Q1614]
MRIKSLHIYGFGKWKDYSVTLDEFPLTVIMGDNEAGKSTIQQYLLFILFGLPPRKREFYQPKSGGSVGGNITVETEKHGEVIVERIHDRDLGEAICRLENGEQHGEVFLKELLGGISKTVYQSIYSFNAEDLLQLQRLTGDELGEVLLNVGLMGSDQIYETTKTLEKELDSQFKPKGRNPKLNQHLEKIEQLTKQRRQAEQEVGNYQQTLEKTEALNKEINELNERVEKERGYASQLSQLKKTLPVIQRFHQLKNVSQPENQLPDDAYDQMRHLQETILPLKSRLNAAAAQLQENREEAKYITSSRADYSYDEAEELLKLKTEYERNLENKNRLEQQINQLEGELETELTGSGISLDLAAYEFPFYLEEKWRSLREETRKLQADTVQWHEKERTLSQQKAQTKRQLEELKNESISEKEAERNSELIDFYIHSQTAASSLASKKSSTLFYAGAGLIFLTGWLLTFLTLETIWLLSGGILSLAVLVSMKLQSKEQGKSASQPVSKEAYNEAREKLQKYEQTKGEYLYLMENWKSVQQEEVRIEERQKQLDDRQNQLGNTIDEQYRDYPFLTKLHIDHWEKLYHLLRQLKGKQQSIEKIKEELHTCYKQLTGIEERLDGFFRACNWEDGQQSHLQRFTKLTDFHEQEVQKTKELKRLEKESMLLTAQKEKLEEELAPLYDQLDSLLHKAGAVDAEHFYKIVEHHQSKSKDWQEKQSVVQQVQLMLTEEEQHLFNVWDAPIRESDVLMEADKQEKVIEELKEKLSDCQKERADAEHQLQQLESSERLSELNHQYAAEREVFQEETKRWAAHKVALEVLKKTKEAYQHNYLPNVLKEASAYFSRLTAGRYTAINLDRNAGKIRVKDAAGQYYLTNELSRGTADQLYISLRLALAKVLSGHQQVPFIVDDAFVHFDKSRLNVMLEIIEELANTQQVILFTWRRDLPEQLESPQSVWLNS